MNFKSLNKILFPVYIYVILFYIYYFYISDLLFRYKSDLLTDIIFYSLLIAYPVFALILINVNLKKIFKKLKYYIIFLFSALPGLVAGTWFGYGLYSAHMYPATTYGFICALIQIGLFGAIIFGILGILINLGFVGFKKIFKPLK